MMSRTIRPLLALVALGALSAGCTTRQVVALRDHQEQPATQMEMNRTDNYYVYQKQTHEFWLCKDEADKLSCKRTCDGSTDLKCPAGNMGVAIAGSNVR